MQKEKGRRKEKKREKYTMKRREEKGNPNGVTSLNSEA